MDEIIEDTPGHQVASNDLILSVIIEMLDVGGLKTFRSVCRQWYQQSLKAWNAKTILHLGPIKPFAPHQSPKWHIDLERFLTFLETEYICIKENESSFHSFSLERWDNKDGTRELEVYSKFFDVCNIRHLRLVEFSFRGRESELHKIVTNKLGDKCSSLELIECTEESVPIFMEKDFRYHGVFKRGPLQESVTELEVSSFDSDFNFLFLVKFPNLKKLKFKSVFDKYSRDLHSTIFPSLWTLRCSKKKRILNITHLDAMDLCDHDMSGCIQADIPLKHLSLRVGDEWGSSSFQEFLEHYSKSLETLKLFRPPVSTRDPFPDFPFEASFKNLTVLELWGNVATNFNFLLVTPSIKRLRVDLQCAEKIDLFQWSKKDGVYPAVIENDLVEASDRLLGNDSFEATSLEELVIDFKLSLESWKVLGKWMPNLKVLEAPLDNQTLKFACGHWSKLQKLRLRFGSKISDEGLIGEGATNKGHITQLKYLKSFELEVECGQGKLTDRSAELGLLRLENLHSLIIYGSQKCISGEMEKRLQNRIGRCQVVRNCPKMFSEDCRRSCCRWSNYRKCLKRFKHIS